MSIYLFVLVDCKWGEWESGECSEKCGGGIRVNTREKIQEDLFGGNPCEGEAISEEECNTQACPGNVIWKNLFAFENLLIWSYTLFC